MSQRRHSTRLVAAITTLLTGSLAGAFGLVLCLGVDGHRAIEFEHKATGCPTLVSSDGATGVSVPSQSACLDFSSAGTGPMIPLAFDADRDSMPPTALLVPVQEPTPRLETRLAAAADARASPTDLAVHLRSTVLLV